MPVTLADLQQTMALMPPPQPRGYRCNQRTYDEMCRLLIPQTPSDSEDLAPFRHLGFMGYAIEVDNSLPDGAFQPIPPATRPRVFPLPTL